LALSTVALIGPVVLLRRHRANVLSKALEEAPPPPRRITATLLSHRSAEVTQPRLSVAQPGPLAETEDYTSSSQAEVPDDFNGALYSAKAFGYATLMVMTGAITTVWGVKTYMGVESTQQFADRMRSLVQKQMPGLVAQIHRRSTEDDHGQAVAPSAFDTTLTVDPHSGQTQWTWPDAEERLGKAFEHGGFSGWADAVMRELEHESKIEREKRGQT
ncbi:hypothetical protein BDW22DRAFT_1332804, partial [Trametopsis cervina]